MSARILLATLVVALVVSFSSVASAQGLQKEAKKETTLKSVSCDPQCGFMVQSHDENELTDIVIAHAKKVHNMDVTAADVRAKIKTVSVKSTKKPKT